MIYTRDAIPDDVPWVVDQLKAFDRFSGTKRPLFPGEPQAAVQAIGWIADDACQFRLACRSTPALEGVAEERLGFLVAALMPHPHNRQWLALVEMFWWVIPEERGSRAGALLYADFERKAIAEAQFAVMTLEHRSPVHPESLTKRGYHAQETTFLREIGV